MGFMEHHWKSQARIKEFRGENAGFERWMAERWSSKPRGPDAPPMSAEESEAFVALLKYLLFLPVLGTVAIHLTQEVLSAWSNPVLPWAGSIAALFLFLYWIWWSDKARRIRMEEQDSGLRAIVSVIVLAVAYAWTPTEMLGTCVRERTQQACMARPLESAPADTSDGFLTSLKIGFLTVMRGPFVYTVDEVRYCLAESTRLDAARAALDLSYPQDIEQFNAAVKDWNTRCDDYRYNTADMTRAQADVEATRPLLIREGQARLSAPVSVESPMHGEQAKGPQANLKASETSAVLMGSAEAEAPPSASTATTPIAPAPEPRPSTAETVSAAAAPGALPFPVEAMLTASETNQDETVLKVSEEILSTAEPIRGDRKLARQHNGAGLAKLAADDLSGAAAEFRAASIADPGDVEIVNNLGYTMLRSGDLRDAERVLGAALLLGPRRASAWANLGQVYGGLGEQSRAIAAFRNAVRFSGNRETTRTFLQKLTESETDPITNAAAKRALADIDTILGRHADAMESTAAATSSGGEPAGPPR